MTSLIVYSEPKNAVAVFTGNTMDETLKDIEKEALSIVSDVSTPKGRAEIKSRAYEIRRSKTALEKAGKNLSAEISAEVSVKVKAINKSRNEAKDFLDNLADTIRLPLTEWEAEEKRKQEEAELKAENELCHSDAIKENDIFDREKDIEEKERIAAEKAVEALRIEEEKRLAAEAIERERFLKEQAAEEAKLKAEREAQDEINEAKRLEAEAIANTERLKREAIEAQNKAKRDAEQAEQNRLQAIEDARLAQENAVRETKEKARLEAVRIEQERLNAEAEKQRQADLLAADLNHRTKLNREALDCFVDNKVSVAEAKRIIALIINGKIKNITINY